MPRNDLATKQGRRYHSGQQCIWPPGYAQRGNRPPHQMCTGAMMHPFKGYAFDRHFVSNPFITAWMGYDCLCLCPTHPLSKALWQQCFLSQKAHQAKRPRIRWISPSSAQKTTPSPTTTRVLMCTIAVLQV